MKSSYRLTNCLRRLPNGPKVLDATSRIVDAYQNDPRPWIVGYSGGKDSTAILKLIFQALQRITNPLKPIIVIYCDTGVEIPLASSLARKCLDEFDQEAKQQGMPIATRLLSPPLRERFFVKVIGRGYPPPTDKFRWCTDRLRIDPVTHFMKEEGLDIATVVLGIREAESSTRKLTLRENQTQNKYWRKQRKKTNRLLFLPIIDFSVTDVWHVNLLVRNPVSLRGAKVADLYAGASGECPTIREPRSAPCGKARFGCWTCTVAKNGITLRNLIETGEGRLKPLLEFRLWLEEKRNDPKYRWPTRRNGTPGPGPMTLEWRSLALEKLLSAQSSSGFQLISTTEIEAIRREWARDDPI